MRLVIGQTQDFLRRSFEENPAFSFGDWTIMYEHSLKVKDVALQIAESVECNKELLAIEALLHDIGKCYKADAKTLRERHAELGYEVAGKFVQQLDFPGRTIIALTEFLNGRTGSTEGQIVKDADAIAFFADVKLQNAFKNWADAEGLKDELQRKADKMKTLGFDISRQIAKSPYASMKKRWNLA